MRKLEVANELLLTEVTELLRKGEQVLLKVKGNSMLPYIVGWRDSVKLKRFDSYSKFDVVLARTSMGVYVLHRIIDISEDNVVLMGDGNIKGVELCKLADISGRVVEVIKGAKVIDYNTKSVKRKGCIWYMLRPLRRYILAIYRRVSKNYYKINK
ncbi:MAG: S24/S26 family peptidase [Bacteroidales bacterium]